MAIQRNVTNGAIAAAILVAIVGALYGQSEYLASYGGYGDPGPSRAPPHARYFPHGTSASATEMGRSFSGGRVPYSPARTPASGTRSGGFSPLATSAGPSVSVGRQPSLSRTHSTSLSRPGTLGTVGGAQTELGGSVGSGQLGSGN